MNQKNTNNTKSLNKTTMEECFEKLEQNPQDIEIYVRLGDLHTEKEQWKDAIKFYQEALKIDPQLADGYRKLALAYSKLKNGSQAVDCWYEAMVLEPREEEASGYINLGTFLLSQKKAAKAIKCYRTAISQKPDLLEAYHHLSKMLSKKGEQNAVISLYRQGVKHNPNSPDFEIALASAFKEQGKFQRAINRYQQALKLDPSLTIAHYNLGRIFIKQKKYDRARKSLLKAISLKPNYGKAYHELGKIYQVEKNWNESIKAYQKAIKFKPDFLPSYYRLGEIAFHTKRYPLALHCYRQTISLEENNSTILDRVISDYKKIIPHIEQKPENLYHQLGNLLRSKSLFGKAIGAYKEALKINPNFYMPYISLQYTEIKAEELEDLIAFYRSIVAENQKNAVAWGNLGDALTQHNKIPEAIDCYRKSSYQQAINIYPQLAELDWKEKKEKGPDFVIGGASKCGTSSLYKYISANPQVLLSHKKELNFLGMDSFDRVGIDWYLAHFPTITDREDFITGEASPNYLRFAITGKRMKEYFPNTKIILLLRNPIDRAVSWHYHKRNAGLTRGSLEEAISIEIKQLKSFTEQDIINSGFRKHDNLLGSLYYYQIKTWMEYIPKEQFLVLKSEDFYSNPEKIMESVFSFLGIPNCKLDNYQKVNSGSYSGIDNELRKTIGNFLAPYTKKLEEYLGISFGWD